MTFPQKNEYFQPANMPAAFGDWNASMVMVAGVLGALVRADRTGEGIKLRSIFTIVLAGQCKLVWQELNTDRSILVLEKAHLVQLITPTVQKTRYGSYLLRFV